MIHPWIFSSSSSFIRTQLLIHLYTFFLDNYLLTSIRLTNLFNLWTFPTFFTNICHKKIYANTVFNGMCTIFDLTDCSLPASSVHRIRQARLLEWVAISFSRVSSQSRSRTHMSCISRQILYHWVTGEVLANICCYCCSFVKLCPTLCDLMDCSTSGFPVFHYLS